MKTSQRHIRGFSLFESLISTVVLAIGLLGLAGLTNTATTSNQDAAQRTQATLIANAIIDTMREDSGNLAAYNLTTIGEDASGALRAAKPAKDCNKNLCTANEVVAFHRWEWQRYLVGESITQTNNNQTTRTGGLVRPVACVNLNGREATVTISWRSNVSIMRAANDIRNSNCLNAEGNAGDRNYLRQVFVTSYI